ncbi:MAG: ABC transporter substrate-binding protein [Lautropia sp.]|nr:ABC transporter substrate-binding protein [Lautropia sp.]
MTDHTHAGRRAWLRKSGTLLMGARLGTTLGGAIGVLAPGAVHAPAHAASATPAGAASAAKAKRIVAMGGTLTEIIFALGEGGRVVGVDASSLYPPEAKKLPQVGYFRQFSVEGVASLKPDLVIAPVEAGPPQAVAGLKGLGFPVMQFELKPSIEELTARIDDLATLLGVPDKGSALIEAIRAEVDKAVATPRKARVLVLSSHAGKMQAAGRDTAIDVQLKLLGADNLMSGSHAGYKPVSGESVAALRPDVIVTSPLSLAQGGGDAFLAQPGIAVTPAARNKRIIVLDDLLMLGFGPRVGESLRLLSAGLGDPS